MPYSQLLPIDTTEEDKHLTIISEWSMTKRKLFLAEIS